MSRYRSARAVLAGAAVIALAGCGSAAGTSVAASHSLAGAASSSAGSASSSAGSASSLAGTTSGAATAAANPGSSVAAGSVPFPVAVGNTWVYDVVSNISGRHTLDTRQVTG